VNVTSGFVGRRNELRILAERLAQARLGKPQVVYIEAEAGAGKSSLLATYLDSLTNVIVIQVGGDESESLLSYGVIDQLRPGTVTDTSTDPMAIGAQLVEFFDQIQIDDRVVVLSVDDLHWVDRPSARALLFALRRLRGDRILTIVCARVGEMTDPGWVRFVDGDDRVIRIRLNGLEPEDLIALAGTLGLGALSRRGAVRLATHTGGNALYCRALLEEIGVVGLSGNDASLPAPRQLSGVVLSRMASLSTPTQSFLAAASVLGQHAVASSIAAIADMADPTVAIEESVGAGLLVERSFESDVSFAHPLYQAAIYGDLSPTTRRSLHERAASITSGHAQLVHRVASALGPDETLANEFEESALLARTAGEFGFAAWALKQAANLSIANVERERRLLDAAVILLDTADTAGAGQVLDSCQETSARRDALTGLLDVFTGSPDAERRLLSAWNLCNQDNDVLIGGRAATSI
jgi:hypothetical protein